MKAGLLQGIYALEVLNQQNYRDFSKIIFLSVPDEEISSRYHVGLITQIAQEHPYVLGLEGAGSIGTVVTRRKGCAHYRLTAEGRASHAGSSPENGRNAVLELAHQIVQAQSFMGWREGFTINAGPIRGGSKVNIVSDFAEIFFDTRFLRLEDSLAAEARWNELLKNQLVPDVKLTLSRTKLNGTNGCHRAESGDGSAASMDRRRYPQSTIPSRNQRRSLGLLQYRGSWLPQHRWSGSYWRRCTYC